MSDQHIILGGSRFDLGIIPLGRLKKLIPALSSASIGLAAIGQGVQLNESTFDSVAQVLASALGKTVAEIEEMPMTVDEIATALGTVAQVAGLVAKEVAPGETTPEQSPAETSTPLTP